jgi:23S rRNA pseudouridine1911/1915/1917 synthase
VTGDGFDFVVGPDDSGRRLDAVVGARPEVESRAEAQRLIDAGRVEVDGKTVAKRHSLADGSIVTVRPAPRATTTLTPEDVPFVIRYEDDALLVVDKPAGVVTHPSRGHGSGTLVHGLLARGIRGGGDAERPGIVHRLDRETSGLLVVAKTDRAHRRLQRMLREHEVERSYVVLVHGAFPGALSVDRPIGRDLRNRTRMSTRTDRPRDARTHFRRIAAFDRHSLLEARLETGRTHQIRVHLEAVGFPVVGDPVYGRRGDELGLRRQFLHARRIAFAHPESGEPIVVESELPPDLDAVVRGLKPFQGEGGPV